MARGGTPLKVEAYLPEYQRYFELLLKESGGSPVRKVANAWAVELSKVPDKEGFNLRRGRINSVWNCFNGELHGLTFYCRLREGRMYYVVAKVDEVY